MHIFTIPYLDKYIVYRPLTKLAFFANAALVNRIAGTINTPPSLSEAERASPWYKFLESIHFWEPGPLNEKAEENPPFAPVACVLCMTTACNFRCTYCYANGGAGKIRKLSPELGFRAIDQVHNNALESGEKQFTVSFHGGGEPTLPFKNFQRLVEYSRKKELPCRIELTSNGYWEREKRAWILDNIDHLSLSFDGIAPVQNRQRPLAGGRGTFAKVMETIQALDECGLAYGIRLTVTDPSIEALPESISFLCTATNCRAFQAEPAFQTGRARDNSEGLENNHLFATAFMAAYDIATEFGRHLYYSGSRPWVITDDFCLARRKALVVTPDGELTSCYEVSGREHPLFPIFHFGELTKEGTLRINETARQNYCHLISERKKICESCFCYWHCAGDCPVKVIGQEQGSHLLFSERCSLNRLLTKELLIRYLTDSGGVWQG